MDYMKWRDISGAGEGASRECQGSLSGPLLSRTSETLEVLVADISRLSFPQIVTSETFTNLASCETAKKSHFAKGNFFLGGIPHPK